jgi:surface polysaccharide O-acyltransferase-like enzyme
MLRKSNFELLRILAMFLIIAHHYSVHGGWNYPNGFEIQKFYAQSLSIGGKVGVNLFVLISGYFLCLSQFKWESVINIVSKTWFYSLFFLMIFYLLDLDKINPEIVINSLLPFQYWFVTAFICMLILTPFVNVMIKSLNKELHFKLILIFTILIIIPILNGNIGNLSLFIYLYCIGAYLRKYYDDLILSNKVIWIVIFLNIFAMLGSIALLDYLSTFNHIFDRPLYFIGLKTPFVLCISIIIFIYFKQLNIANIKSINIISSTMFGVYLIHDNLLVREFLWNDLFENKLYLNNNYIYLHSIVSIVSVFLCCIIIDLIRSKIVVFLSLKKINLMLLKAKS